MKNLKLYILLTFVITLCSQISCNSIGGSEPERTRVSSDLIGSAIPKADALFKQRDDVAKLRDAISLLAAARDPNGRNFEVEWKFAKYNYFLGKLTADEKAAEAIFSKGRDAGKIASGLDPGKPDGYFWYGANLGELTRMSPLTIGVESVDEIRMAMNKVLELQPDYQKSSAYDALAQVELGTRLTGGSAHKAIEYLEKGRATEDDNMNLRLHLAEAYLAVKRSGDARRQLEELLQMKPNPEYLPEHKDAVEKAREMLETRF